MMDDLKIFGLAGGLAEHAAARQALVAENVANADTPGYRARDLQPFADRYAALGPVDGPAFAPAATRPGHAAGPAEGDPRFEPVQTAKLGAASPNGNTVSIEDQMARGAEIRLQHDMALGIWRKSLDILRASLGRAR